MISIQKNSLASFTNIGPDTYILLCKSSVACQVINDFFATSIRAVEQSMMVNEEFHPAKSGYLSSRHWSNLHDFKHVIAVIYTCYVKQYMLRKVKNKFMIHSNTSQSNLQISNNGIQKDYFDFCLILTSDILLSSNAKYNWVKYQKYFANFEHIKAITVL